MRAGTAVEDEVEAALRLFDDDRLPVPLFGAHHVGAAEKGPIEAKAALQRDEAVTDAPSVTASESPNLNTGKALGQPAGVSSTKVNRGGRRWTFLNEGNGELLGRVLARVFEFSADTFHRLGSA
jgi:hypothetical protein